VLPSAILSDDNILFENNMDEQTLYNNLRESLVLLAAGGQRALESYELTIAQYDVLHLLGLEAGQRMGELSGRLLSDNSKMTRIIDYLSEKGWVERRPDPTDRRAWCVYLTDAGAKQREEATSAHQRYLKEQFAALDDQAQEQFRALLAALRQNLVNN
jgi:DNA-binding MarR family transcriptional regulator